jgi:hypothetical protein
MTGWRASWRPKGGRQPASAHCFRQHGVAGLGAAALPRRHELGDDALPIRHEDGLARRREADILTQAVLQDLQANSTHGAEVASGSYLANASDEDAGISRGGTSGGRPLHRDGYRDRGTSPARGLVLRVLDRGAHEALEERVWPVRPAPELGVELAGHEPGVVA